MYTNLIRKQLLKSMTKFWHLQSIKCSVRITNTAHSNVDQLKLKSRFGREVRTYCNNYTEASNQRQCSDINNTRNGKETSLESYETEKVNGEYVVNVNAEAEGDENVTIKNLLYDERQDDIMELLHSCENCAELNKLVLKFADRLKKEHVIQSVILMGSLTKDALNENLLRYLLTRLEPYILDLNINEASCTFLYLRKMQVPKTHPVMCGLLTKALDSVNDPLEFVDLAAVSQLAVAINTGRDFFTPILCANFINRIHKYIKKCRTAEDARLLAICVLNLQPLIDYEILNAFKERISILLQNGVISANCPKVIVKLLNMLNIGVWSHKNTALIRDLLTALKPCVKQLEGNVLKNVCRIYLYNMEPATLHESLAVALEDLLNREMSPEALAYFVPFSEPVRRNALINTFKTFVNSSKVWEHSNSTAHLFSALRALKISDTSICDMYWNGVLKELNYASETDIGQLRFLRHCHRYMYFNNNLGGTYRHLGVEQRLSQMAIRAIKYDVFGRIPQIFARLASFVFAYGHTPHYVKKYPNILLSKIINMAEQFTPGDCFLISRGLYISLELRYRYQIPPLVNMQLATIDSVLASCAERCLNISEENQHSLHDLNWLVRCLSNRKTLKNSVIYHRILAKYKDVKCDDLNSRILKDMAYIFTTTNYLVPEILESMLEYITNNYEHIGGETVEKVLTCAYNLGYIPKSSEPLQKASLIMLRDFNYMNGLSLVQACLALCFYKAISQELIDKVFCVNFIERVENEIQMCYSKATYPERVLNLVMQLNRSVCLDYPECNVPWFQQNFIEAHVSNKPFHESTFSRDVRKFLETLLQDESYFRCNHVTPYGYQIDFVIHFDKDKKAIKAPTETTMLHRITKVAILLLKLDSFCENDLKALRGPDSLKVKHLEMMGYKVLRITEHEWNSKYMNANQAKRNYLKCLLQITN
ncbi:FAST kinase domain-containing protein 1, mitochondrial [Glossina fuscipes]|uniref:FAST kinase domain-containing protein 1, mitochondrial n=1 Tax=Glossina fuscipes TaxID=7396 RepID=A0A9C5ZDA2_9MUSC|nr:FAST kinase domain-containing protein 1, mitochondrial [Glossina fuscipes]